MIDQRRLMLRGCGLLLLAPVLGRAAEGPRQNLLVELRWAESSVSGAAVAGVRQGGVVVGTAGSVSPRPGLTLSTRRQEAEGSQIQRVLVLNGYQASVLLSETELLQWLDYGVELRGGGRERPRIHAQTHSLPIERQRGFVLTPSWPGGKQPVRVELRALGAGQQSGAQSELLSTVLVAMGDWLTVARSGAATRQPQAGVISSSDAEGQSSRELQLRVTLAP
ncbi:MULTISPECIES: hypothetical protein [unclassified Roseateles]|uniref:hypothetical protein n=1 Tax=unclassified Roseateles TaxID=2626991 RepID=UPI0022B8EC81|nr:MULTISPECIES: hypothetical protein [unclassified Roseateles]MCZ7880362.1 hypothetical protein [Paucibacter sp. M5-1]MDC6168030.1 hypothetical protein [Paucibacter sp. XJ19-41]